MAMALRNRLLSKTAVNAVSRRFAHIEHNQTHLPTNPYNRFVYRTKDEIDHDIHEIDKWQKITFGMTIVCLSFGIYVYKHPEVHEPRKEYPYMNVRAKDFPWGPDPLFETLFGKHEH